MSGLDFCSITVPCSSIGVRSASIVHAFDEVALTVALELIYFYALTNKRQCRLCSVTMQTISHDMKLFLLVSRLVARG